MAEFNGRGIAAVLAADTDVHFGTYGFAELDRHLHELAYADLVELCERVVFVDLGIIVRG